MGFTSTACPCCRHLTVFHSEGGLSAYDKRNTMFCIVISLLLLFYSKNHPINTLFTAVAELAYKQD